MKRTALFFAILILLLFSLACQTVTSQLPGWLVTATETATATPTIPPTLNPTRTPQIEPSAAPSATAKSATSTGFDLRLHPEGGLYVGDLVSFEIIAPAETNLDGQTLMVTIGDVSLDPATFIPFGIGGRQQATLRWAWDTHGLQPGIYDMELVLEPSGQKWNEQVELFPLSAVPPPEPQAGWQAAQSECCIVHYVSGTAAERDLPNLLPVIDRQAEEVATQFGQAFAESIEVVLLPRVLGHGGFADGEIAVSYLDRNYANNDLAQVLQHELVHILDRRQGGEYLPSLFTEGLAVYLSGGHYKREPLLPRAATLLELDRYLPLELLANDFYNSQHEIGYLEAGALVQFMVQEWGWETFNRFYRQIERPDEEEAPSTTIDAALHENYGMSFAQLEVRFLTALKNRVQIPDLQEDVKLVIALYDTVRRYQQQLDPSAYFLTAWLLDGKEMREGDIVADYLRHPNQTDNQSLEIMLTAAGEHYHLGQYPEARRLLAAVNAVLSRFEMKHPDPFGADQLAGEILALVQAAQANGLEPQGVFLKGTEARMRAVNTRAELVDLSWEKIEGSWVLKNSN